ncbi:HipA-like N-terminal domain-containing protein [Desulfocicer vacuolatum DSM 3385]|uniref:HipA-like N-terminal domain-containing protein n=1 Tax=Desulfocicer vacuolatum DSM 3385 TaxID=1121400 RepID=A0A1W2DY64_9BACT|nr:type II toxin-antitoxin system HipA family toxin YjjJ [Desulfocicer vacuolatum]SMD02369.1 HipA-like N-terminal domain-containing protein [Desulfocicer vacuolatum DSM 3385]
MPLTIKKYIGRGPSTSKEIQAATGLSQSSVARRLREMRDSVVQIQEGRLIRYAATCNAFGADDKIPLGIIDHTGKAKVVAFIRPLIHGGFFLEPLHSISNLLLGERGNGLYDGLPYFLYDLRPQGYLGRQVAREISKWHDDFPSDPRQWTNKHIGKYLISNGDDLPGNFIFGEQAFIRIRRRATPVTINNYPKLAENVMKGELPGSSAGGEQPKFTAFKSDHPSPAASGNRSHVIVKFSPKGNNDVAQRWRDILVTEYHASRIIRESIYLSAETNLFEMDGRLFLETQRFDRFGEFGRASMVSLQSIDNEFVGLGHSWPKIMNELFTQNLVPEQDVLTTERLWYFGQLINNTDMHPGNLSLTMERNSFRLLPCYDMCSMGFAPKSGGEAQPFLFDASDIPDANFSQEELERLKRLAHTFWNNVTKDERISEEFKRFLDQGNPLEPIIQQSK